MIEIQGRLSQKALEQLVDAFCRLVHCSGVQKPIDQPQLIQNAAAGMRTLRLKKWTMYYFIFPQASTLSKGCVHNAAVGL